MLRPTSGAIRVAGLDLARAPERRLPSLRARRFGFVFQDFNLLSALTALENVELACNLASVTGHAAQWRARGLLERVGLAHRLGFRPEQLSGGEKQRVAIAARWPMTRRSSWPTSRPPTSTPPSAARSPGCCASSPPRTAARW
jgi:putative ABC transport system ATP-binding protein